MGKSYLRGFASLLGLLPVLGHSPTTHNALAAPSGDAASCTALLARTIAPHTVVTSAEYAPEGRTVGNTKVDIPFCRIVGIATPTTDSRIGFEVWLPATAQWNGRFQAEGSGGSAGAISPGPMLAALKRGFATMSTDNGHLNDPNDPTSGYSQLWAYRHPQKMIDWGWRALHLSTVAAKLVVKDFYGKAAVKNYFVGCSAGGHHALAEATRFPADYDGIIAGAAPWAWTSLMIGHTWNSTPSLKDPAAITADSARILNAAMVAACDRLDGVEDGLIADPRRCTVDPAQFQCGPARSSECLTPAQVAAARHIYAGPVQSDGTRLLPGQVRGSEPGWVAQMTGPRPGGSSWDFWRLTVFQDESFSNARFDFDKDVPRALATKVSDSTLPQVYDSTPDLRAFQARGGKLLMFHGWSDHMISALVGIDFHDRIAAKQGQTDSFLRLFLLPGMAHCSGGPGFSHIGGATGAPLKDDADHDIVRALEAWVEDKAAPTRFIAARMGPDGKPAATRPVCLYPRQARYRGTGDVRDAASFVCADPGPSPG
jgi:feruloyl esterase